MRWRTIAAAALILAAPARAGAQPSPPAILDLAALPPMMAGGRAGYAERFLIGNLPRAFAIAANGAFGAAWNTGSLPQMRAAALESCAAKGGHDCAIYAENLDVVWPGRAAEKAPGPPGPLMADQGHAFVPDARFLWRGPEAARGIFVWGHGRNGDNRESRGGQPPPFVRLFNNAGYDVVRFDRAPEWDSTERAAGWLRDGLVAFRRMGWRSIVVSGQSRGAWNSLQMLQAPGLADAVIAVSPATNGIDAGAQILYGETDLYRMFSDADAPLARVAFVQFAGDPFAGDAGRRVALVERLLRPHVGALLEIDRPAGYAGHFGGYEAKFAEQFGACLQHFATDPSPPQHCGDESARR